ncbi:acyltransferase [Limimaricola soesokkakensis]|uniref:acyltransferase n=1 Tax=Limimaricola soesokkakensis TaxID=1343159 RepID=UPI000A2702CC|nr:acyltransferase [Limimaricola soesokkakensis]
MKNITRLLRWLLRNLRFAILGGAEAARRSGVSVGQDCRIYIREFGSEPFLISIGSRTTIAAGVVILTHDGSTSLVRDAAGHRYQRYAPVLIGDDVFIGANSIIMPGVAVRSRCIVGAGSIVTKDVPEGSVVAGNPARVIQTFDNFSLKIKRTCVSDGELSEASNYERRVALAMRLSAERSEVL